VFALEVFEVSGGWITDVTTFLGPLSVDAARR
jgi:hypothetical protein